MAGIPVERNKLPVCWQCCDANPRCQEFILSHSHPPVHVFSDLNGRLSQSAIKGLDAVEEQFLPLLKLCAENPDKTFAERVGADMLLAYLEVLDREKSMLSHAFCHAPRCI